MNPLGRLMSVFYYRKIVCILILVILNLHFLEIRAQDSLLQHRITLTLNQVQLSAALDSIAKQANSFVTYNSNLIKVDKKVDVRAKNEPLVRIMTRMLNDTTLSFHVVKRQIIISPLHLQHIKKENKTPLAALDAFFQIRGQVMDKYNKKPLPYATIGIRKKHLGAVSNGDGEFVLKIGVENLPDTLTISYVGYRNYTLPLIDYSGKSLIIQLEQEHISLQEVIIRNTEPVSLIRSAIQRIKQNYPQNPVNLTAFYRESVKKSRQYIVYTEAVLNIYKSAYNRSGHIDLSKIVKSRKIYDVNRSDTVSVRLRGGVDGCLKLDIIKNIPEFLQEENFLFYRYHLADISIYDNRPVYIIEFEPLETVRDPLFEGRVYIDLRTLAFVRAEFGYPARFARKIKNRFILKKERTLDVKPLQVDYLVSYREINGKYYFNHSRGELKLRARHKKKLFASTFEIAFEMATTQLDSLKTERFRYREILKPNTILSKENLEYDSDFWENQTFIHPEDDIQQALKRIVPKIEEISQEDQ